MTDYKTGEHLGEGLFVDSGDCTNEQEREYEEDPMFDTRKDQEEYVQGDESLLLVVLRAACVSS